MAIFKSIAEKIRILVILAIVIMLIYGVANAIINIAGKSVVPGRGLYYGSGPLYDTMLVRTSYFFTFYGDSASPDTAHLKDIFATATHTHTGIESTWIADNGIAQADLRDNVIGNAECQAIDSAWIVTGGIGSGSIKDGDIDNADIKTFEIDSSKATNTFVKGIQEVGGTWVSGYVTFTEGAGITITQTGNDFTFANSTGGGGYYGQNIVGGSLTGDTLAWLGGYGITLRHGTSAGTRDTFVVTVDTTTMKALWIDPWELGDSLGDYFTQTAVKALIGDSLGDYLTATAIQVLIEDSLNEYLTITATGDAIHDSIWKSDPLPPLRSFALREGVDDSISINYFIATDVSNWCVKHYNFSLAQANQMDTIVYSWDLPDEVPDIDSVTFNMRSSSADTGVSGLRIRCFKQTEELGSQTALTAGLIGYFTATDAWEHKTIAGASIGAVTGGNNFSIRMCAQLDVAAVLYHDEPKVYCPHK